MTQAIIIILIVISAILIVLLFVQGGKVKNIGSSIVGTTNIELFENTKKRGSEKILNYLTIILIGLFIILSFVLFIV